MRIFTTHRRFALAGLLLAGSGLAFSVSQAQEEEGTEAPNDSLAALYYARQAIDADTDIAGLVGRGSDDTWACASCHGDLGQGAETVPRLAGLPAGYITKQLHDYANEQRLNANMQYVVQGLDDDQMAALGKYYAQLEAPSTAEPALGGDLERGRTLALEGDWSIDVPACYSCHGSTAWGVGQAFPALASQHASYIYNQLANWKSGRRANSPVQLMHGVATALSSDDMRSVADYLASLPAPPRQALTLDTPAPHQLSATPPSTDRQGGSADE